MRNLFKLKKSIRDTWSTKLTLRNWDNVGKLVAYMCIPLIITESINSKI